MKKLILIACLVIGSAYMAGAQVLTQKSPDQRAVNQTKALQKRLNLTPQQAEQANAIFLTQATRMDSLKANPSIDKKTDGITRRTILLTSASKINAILTPDQQQAFQQLMAEKKEKIKARKQAVPPTAMPPDQN